GGSLKGGDVQQRRVQLVVEQLANRHVRQRRDRSAPQRHREREADRELKAERPGHGESSRRSMKPTPRTVSIRGSRPPLRSLRRRLPTCTSTTLLIGSKCRS